MAEVYKSITDKVADKENELAGRIYPMFKGNQHIMYVYKTYRDIRLVGAPQKALCQSLAGIPITGSGYATPVTFCVSCLRQQNRQAGSLQPDNVPMTPKHFTRKYGIKTAILP